MTKKREGNLIRFFVKNLEAAGVTATFEPFLVNLHSSTPFPYTMAVPPGETAEVFSLSPIQADKFWTYTLTNHFTLGNHHAVHDDTYLYQLPYAAGESFPVSQAFGGTFSHSGPEQYAIDWSMPEGTEVLAARDGTVVGLRDDSVRGGPAKAFENDANYVLIQHNDGTIGNYAHLMRGGLKVKIGDFVRRGEVIALSGNTGFSSGPHLHFSVFKPRDGKNRESIPIQFGIAGQRTTLLQGQAYKNVAPLLTTRFSSKGARY